MLYQSYKTKLEKRKKLILVLWKLRFVIIAAILLLIAGTALLCITGTVYSEDFDARIYYGESLKTDAKAFFRPVEYEFRASEEGEWVKTAPKLAGDYEVRAYSKDIFGAIRYGKIHSYKILPAPVEVKIVNENLDYGAMPECSAELKYGDKLQTDGFIFEPLEDGNFYVTARTEGITVLSEEGGDVTQSYTVTALKKAIVNNPRSVTLKTQSASFVYDGAPHSAEGIEVISPLKLLDGHTIEAFYPSVTEVSSAENMPQITIKDSDGSIVTRYYSVNYITGELSVTPAPITVSTDSGKFVYDGESHSAEFAKVSSGNLASGHSLYAEYPAAVVAGSHKNEPLSLNIVNSEGEDKTQNYKITLKAGTITISPKVITITTPSGDWIYDGAEHFKDQYEYDENEILQGHSFSGTIISYAKITNAGNIANTLEIKPFISDCNGVDVTENYTLNYSSGKLAVSPRKFKVKTGDCTWVYDKKLHTCLDFTLMEPVSEDEGLLDGAVAVPHSEGIANITDSDEIAYANNVLYFTVTQYGKDVTGNYEAYGEWGKLRVKSPVEITVFSKSKQYDGLPLVYKDTDYAVTKLPPDVKKEWVSAKIKGELNAVGEFRLSEVAENSTASLIDGEGKDRTLNGENRIDFVGESAPLKILPRAIEVTSISISKTAGEEPLSGNVGKNSAWISLGSLLEGHRIEITVGGLLLPDRLSAQNTITSVQIFDSKGNNVTSLYSVTLRHGTLKWI